MDNLFDQFANISKAHAYDIIVKQRNELMEENKRLKEAMKLHKDVDLGKAFEYFKSQIDDAELELRAKNGENGAYAYAYGRVKESCKFLIEQCVELEPDDIPAPLFSGNADPTNPDYTLLNNEE